MTNERSGNEIEKELAEARRELAKVQEALRQKTIEAVQGVLSNAARNAPIKPEMPPLVARSALMDHLLMAEAIALPDGLGPLLVECGFDASLVVAGCASGIDLLKFVGFVKPNAPNLQEAQLDMALNEDSTQH